MASRVPTKAKSNKLGRSAKSLQAEAENTAHQVGQHAKEMAQELRNGVAGATRQAGRVAQESYELARNTAANYVDEGRQRASDIEQNFEAYVTERPLRSVAIAAGIGFVAALFFLRRS